MKRNCNLELRLVTPSVHFHSNNHHYSSMSDMADEEGISPKESQKLTIFYNGRIAACDVTEFQARAIILLASRETTEDVKFTNSYDHQIPSTTTSVNSPAYSPTTGLSMKRSLQRFLQKRKNRAQAISPYPQPSH